MADVKDDRDWFFNPSDAREPTALETEFNNGVREITILVLIAMILYFVSYTFMTLWRRRDRDEDEFTPFSWEDEIVYRTSFCLCAVSLAVSIGSAMLLPISTISNEILHTYPSSWYMKWLNSSLIHGLWNSIFVMSNCSLFLLLPFAYLFCESEGLPFFGCKGGLVARTKETLLTLVLFSITTFGMMYVLAALIYRDKEYINRILNVYSYLPFLYSCVSFVGVLMLLVCTPLGFATLFTVVGDMVVKPTFMRNLEEEYFAAKFELDGLKQKIKDCKKSEYCRITPVINEKGERLQNGSVINHYEETLKEVSEKCQILDLARKTPVWRRTLGYPLVMLILLALTAFSLICVLSNVGQIVVGIRSLPVYHQTVDLGINSLSSLGIVGVFIEVILIFYLQITSIVGLYTIPIISKIRPTFHNTSLRHLILNCIMLLVLSSALPVLSKILGITNFDLLGSFGEVKWLGDYYIVLFYNAVFAGAASLCLFKKFTARVRREIMRRISLYISTVFKRNIEAKQKLGMFTSPFGNSAPSSPIKAD